MTKKEAIKILRSIRVYDIYPKAASEETKQALDLAIKALEERPREWIRKVDEAGFISHICSKCGAEIEVEDCSDDKFCFNCGAKMKEAENDRDCEHCAHYVKAGLDWFCCESWECEFKPKGDEKND